MVKKTAIKEKEEVKISKDDLDNFGSQSTVVLWTCKETGVQIPAHEQEKISAHIQTVIKLKEQEKKKQEAKIKNKENKEKDKKWTKIAAQIKLYDPLPARAFEQITQELLQVINKDYSIHWNIPSLKTEEKELCKKNHKILLEGHLKIEGKENVKLKEEELDDIKKALVHAGVYWNLGKRKTWDTKDLFQVEMYGGSARMSNGWVKMVEKIKAFQVSGMGVKITEAERKKMLENPNYNHFTNKIKDVAKKIHDLRIEHQKILEAREKLKEPLKFNNF